VSSLYRVEFSHHAEKQFSKLSSEVQQRVISALERTRIRPKDFLIKLVGSDAYKIRVGDYRIICAFIQEKQIILVLKVGHRKNIYD